MFEENHKCLTCGFIGPLDFEYSTDQDTTFATFSGKVRCSSCETYLHCYGLLDIYEDQPVDDPMDWLMDISYDGYFDEYFEEAIETNNATKEQLCIKPS